MDDIAARSRIVTASSARDLADWGRTMVETLSGDFEPGEAVKIAVQLKHASLILLDRVVLTERAAGATWAEIAAQHHLSVEQVINRYADVYEKWERDGKVPAIIPTVSGATHYGLEQASDLPGQAVSTDQWRARHMEPWEEPSGRSLAAML